MWSEEEIQALFAEVNADLGTTLSICTEARLNALLTELELFVWDWDYNSMCERSAMRTAQRVAQEGSCCEE